MGKRGRPPHPDILTPREWQVLDLLRQDLTNEQIAQRLDISYATAKYHVAEIISKLGVQTREQAAAWQPKALPWWQRALAWVPRRALPLAGAAGGLAALAVLAGSAVMLWATRDGQELPAVAQISSPTPNALTTPSQISAPTPAPAPTVFSLPTEQLSYVGPNGDIRLVNPDGSENQVLVPDACDGDVNPQAFILDWSPSGDYLAYICQPGNEGPTLIVVDDFGAQVLKLNGIFRALWSPDGSTLAFQEGAGGVANNQIISASVSITRVADWNPQKVVEDGQLMAWLKPESLILARNFVLRDFQIEYEAWELSLADGTQQRLPRFDEAPLQFWNSPAGDTVVLPVPPQGEGGPGASVAVLDLASGLETIIDGARIGYPSEGIPRMLLAYTTDASAIYWANAADSPVSIWRADLHEMRAVRVGDVGSIFTWMSPEGRAASLRQASDVFNYDRVQPITIWSADGSVAVGSGSLPLGWRPVNATP
jgi:DNA-binding CsgD family transcriptional regulator